MTTPTPEQKDYAKFNTDFQDYQNSLSEYSALTNGNGTDMPGAAKLHNAYQTELDGIKWNGKNPWIVFMSVMQLILDPGTAQINNKVDQTGQQSKCQTALLKCQNDLENITNAKGGGTQGVKDEATGLDKMMAALSGTETDALPGQGINGTVGQETQAVFGASGCADLEQNLSTVRGQIFIAGGDIYEGKNYNPTSATASSVYFDTSSPTPTGKMDSYGQMQRRISEQGDPDNAIEANTQKTNAFGTNTSTLQSVQQSTKEMLTQWMNTEKTIASAGSMFGHAIGQVSSTAQQNMRPQ